MKIRKSKIIIGENQLPNNCSSRWLYSLRRSICNDSFIDRSNNNYAILAVFLLSNGIRISTSGYFPFGQSEVSDFETFLLSEIPLIFIRSGEARGPGLFFILPCIDEIRILDLRTVTCSVSPQEILTRDSVTVSVDAVVYHRVSNPLNATIKVLNIFQVQSANKFYRIVCIH